MTDNVNHPAHYTRWPVEVIDLTEREDFLYGNVLKYALRAGAKPGAAYGEDMAKAVWYAARFVSNIAKVMSVTDGLRALREREEDADEYLASCREDTAEMRRRLQDQLAAIYDQVEKELCEAWDAT
nr:MAG TPA: nucelotide kinase [Caudoviricetes sp.]